jgi:hypothetical protein
MIRKRKKECELWSGSDHIPQAFAASSRRSDVSLTAFLNGRPVVVRNDPALAQVFGQDAVDRYEAMLTAASDES